MASPKPLTPAELRAHPSRSQLVVPSPTVSGKANVTSSDRSSVYLHYELFGQGTIKILWNNGQGASFTSWRRQMVDFGLADPDKYTSCFYSYRSYEESGGSWAWHSPRNGAEDALKLLDHLGWTGERDVHVVGTSMGGYVAQNIALLAGSRLASLTLASTTNRVADVFTLSRVSTLLADSFPRSEARRWDCFMGELFGPDWQYQPDEEGLFPTNRDRIIAEMLLSPAGSLIKGAILQAPGAYAHSISPDMLADVGQKIGHKNLLVIHGSHDRTIPVEHGRRVHQYLGGDAKGVALYIVEQAGHLPHIERREEFKEKLTSLFERTTRGATR